MVNIISNFIYLILIILGVFCALFLLTIVVLTAVILYGSRDSSSCFLDNAPVIVPGCRIKGDKPSLTLKNRLDAAFLYLKAHKKSKCIVCGGQFGRFTQSEVMKKYLEDKGISADKILEENESRTTFENMKNARKLLPSVKEVYIATNTYHFYRSKLYASKFGFEVNPLRAKTPASQFIFSWLREYAALIKAFIKQ